ncbi:protein-export chaperone SecB [Aureibaculum sp. A20]|uniref:Protein-export chaperone SecB n=1 Tax=Aureibaculum flavum TaxID=2795986 RepID=A0ABS0WPZ5_9FLAO|nr:protein-export chaperone SecB [Aureibaculum flavum]MBJ2174056.1 protein-export chaperone SecB [Aureibaculum flavum]
MEKPKKAAFSFKKFTVPRFSYNQSLNEKPELDLLFNPRGEYNKEKGLFNLILNLSGTEKTDKAEIIQIESVATFKFSENIDIKDIPEYFYANSIAIMFPYVRSFISTLTLQSNTGIIMLEILNLSAMKETLRENTKAK